MAGGSLLFDILSFITFEWQSVSSERKTNALEASFVYAPAGEDVDWRLSATIAPCHVTVGYFFCYI